MLEAHLAGLRVTDAGDLDAITLEPVRDTVAVPQDGGPAYKSLLVHTRMVSELLVRHKDARLGGVHGVGRANRADAIGARLVR